MKASTIIKKRDNSDLDHFSRGVGDEKYSNSGYILKVEPRGLSNGLRCQLEVSCLFTDLENPGGEQY